MYRARNGRARPRRRRGTGTFWACGRARRRVFGARATSARRSHTAQAPASTRRGCGGQDPKRLERGDVGLGATDELDRIRVERCDGSMAPPLDSSDGWGPGSAGRRGSRRLVAERGRFSSTRELLQHNRHVSTRLTGGPRARISGREDTRTFAQEQPHRLACRHRRPRCMRTGNRSKEVRRADINLLKRTW